MEVTRILEIINEKGMHARAAAKFVDIVDKYECDVEVYKDGVSAFGNSIMGLLMLAASRGTSIEVRVNGENAVELADALEELVNDKFRERF